jgi:hypothetical protein
MLIKYMLSQTISGLSLKWLKFHIHPIIIIIIIIIIMAGGRKDGWGTMLQAGKSLGHWIS